MTLLELGLLKCSYPERIKTTSKRIRKKNLKTGTCFAYI